MLLQPKNRKFKKDQKGYKKHKGHIIYARATKLEFGSYGIKALQQSNIKASQIEAVRRVIIRQIRKIGKIWIRIFPYKPISKKPTKMRMGKGKGSVQYWVCPVLPGQILFEINGSFTEEQAKEVLDQASQKLPILTKFATRTSVVRS